MCFGGLMLLSGGASATPVEEVKSMVGQAQQLFAKGKASADDERTKTLVRAATKYARAYALIIAQNLKKDAGALFEQIIHSILQQ